MEMTAQDSTRWRQMVCEHRRLSLAAGGG